MEHPAILVTGVTGRVGGHVVSELIAAGHRVRAMVRDPGSAEAAGLPSGVEVVRGDLGVPDSLAVPLEGVEAVFLVWPLGRQADPAGVVGAIAARRRRIVYLSTIAIRDDLAMQDHPLSAMHLAVEREIVASGCGWTILRASKFATNTFAWVPEIRREGVVALTHGDALRSPIHQRDIAAVAARALVESGHAGAIHRISGPESLSEREQVRIIGEAIGRPLAWREVDPETARAEMLADGTEPDLADAALAYWARLVTHPEPVTTTVEEITGHPARTFRSWAQEHADRFRQSPDQGSVATAR